MNTVKVRDIEIGAGAPKIIVPIVGVTKNDIIEEAKTFHSIPVDVVEWRVDWFEGVFDFAQVEDALKDLRAALGNIPILMTFRTSKEGGEKAIEPEAYAELNIKAAQTGYVDLIDVEVFTGDEIVKKIIDGAHAAGRITCTARVFVPSCTYSVVSNSAFTLLSWEYPTCFPLTQR